LEKAVDLNLLESIKILIPRKLRSIWTQVFRGLKTFAEFERQHFAVSQQILQMAEQWPRRHLEHEVRGFVAREASHPVKNCVDAKDPGF
jgi:hypothetical protein